ncbi:phage tail domain-containing protein [Priestia flexa]|uniref:phage tail domain-containing protein n=1 Tax=Priestia flexa TaxID=86664 RepID=UPI0006879E30|nr:phage tail domain-containing protein [Priestia flexa]
MINDSLEFTHNGVHSSQLGIINVNVEGGLFDEVFMASKTIRETTIVGRHKPYFQGVEYSPLTFPITLYFENGYTSDSIREVARTLCTDYYAPLIFSKNTERIFFATFVDEGRLVHNGCNEGYITLTVRCNSPFTYSHIIDSPEHHVKNEGLIEFVNNGDLPIKPQITIYKVGKGSLSIKNLSNHDEPFVFDELEDKEIVYIDNEEEEIETNLPLTYRYDNFNEQFLEMERGVNRLLVTGSCVIKITYQFIFLNG